MLQKQPCQPPLDRLQQEKSNTCQALSDPQGATTKWYRASLSFLLANTVYLVL
jgi:hypothetical protein